MLLRAFAKINLDLRIAGRRDDGFHEVGTVLQTIDWFDEIRIDPSHQFEFATTAGPGDETNLVVRAVRGFEQLTGAKVRLRILLTKNVPMGAGLGGGSADAAVTVLGLQRWFREPLTDEQVVQILRGLGSDVSFFAVGGCAAGLGKGDEIVPLNDEILHTVLIVVPDLHISTAEAYSWLTVQDKPRNIEGFRAQFLSGHRAEQAVNDFEAAVFLRYAELGDIKHRLIEAGARKAALSGSGSAIFGLFDREEDARKAAGEFNSGFRVRLTNAVPRTEYLRRVFADS